MSSTPRTEVAFMTDMRLGMALYGAHEEVVRWHMTHTRSETASRMRICLVE